MEQFRPASKYGMDVVSVATDAITTAEYIAENADAPKGTNRVVDAFVGYREKHGSYEYREMIFIVCELITPIAHEYWSQNEYAIDWFGCWDFEFYPKILEELLKDWGTPLTFKESDIRYTIKSMFGKKEILHELQPGTTNERAVENTEGQRA